MVLIDLQKALDTVNHNILLNKPVACGMNVNTVQWFNFYLTNTDQCVDLRGIRSSSDPITCGVPQGSILGPLLFSLYVNDMVSAVTSCKLMLYADDSALLVSGKDVNTIQSTLSRELESLNDWLCDNRLSLHLGKTESILFGSPQKLK